MKPESTFQVRLVCALSQLARAKSYGREIGMADSDIRVSCHAEIAHIGALFELADEVDVVELIEALTTSALAEMR